MSAAVPHRTNHSLWCTAFKSEKFAVQDGTSPVATPLTTLMARRCSDRNLFASLNFPAKLPRCCIALFAGTVPCEFGWQRADALIFVASGTRANVRDSMTDMAAT
jgi:hypothetical protein